MPPGVPPTHRYVEVALVAIVRFRDGKLAHEHIYWDQASVLQQLGLLNDTGLPVRGAESAAKVRAGGRPVSPPPGPASSPRSAATAAASDTPRSTAP